MNEPDWQEQQWLDEYAQFLESEENEEWWVDYERAMAEGLRPIQENDNGQ